MVTTITETVDIDNPLLHPDPPHAMPQGLAARRMPSLDGVSVACTPDDDHESCSESDSESDTESAVESEILQDMCMISRDVSGEINTQKLVEKLRDFHLCIPKFSTTLSTYTVHFLFMEKATLAKQSLVDEINVIMLDHPEVHDPSQVSFYKLQLSAIRRALLVLDTFEKVLWSQEEIHRRVDSCHVDRRSTATRLCDSQDTNLLICDGFISSIVQPAFDFMNSLIAAGLILKNPEWNPTRNSLMLARPQPAPGLFSDASSLGQHPVPSPRQFSESVGAFNEHPPSYYEATNPISVTNTVIRNVGNLAGGGYSAFVGSTNFDHNLTGSRPSSNAFPLIPLSYYSGFNSGNATNLVIDGVGNTHTVSVTENDGVGYTYSSASRGRTYYPRRSGYQ